MTTRRRRPPPRGRRGQADRHPYDQYGRPDSYYEDDHYTRDERQWRDERGGDDDYYADSYLDDHHYYDDRRRGGRLITPARLLLALVFLGAAAVSGYGLFVARSLPITVSGLAVLGGSAALLGLVAGASAVRLGRGGHGGRAILAAVIGGVLVLGASGSLAAALVLGLLAVPD